MPKETYFAKLVAVAHRNTVISHLIYLKFALVLVCIVSSGRLFFHAGSMTCVSGLHFNCNHNYLPTILKIDYRNFQNLFDVGLEYCYELFQAMKYSIANWKSSKCSTSGNNQFWQIAIFLTLLLKTLEDIKF